MKLKYQRTGGFANLQVNVEVDTDKLPPEVAEQAKALVNKMQPFAQEVLEPMPDVCSYLLTVEDAGVVQTLNTNDMRLTDEMQELFSLLMDQK